ncbi:MAG: VTT domain-containing protein [Simkaniaceae bacterium]|nr:VTT domain-containing protein [Simkaniaceae bacterium]MCF7852384.1 VTT domain-containing protein [Simkaniaceae bacterium]
MTFVSDHWFWTSFLYIISFIVMVSLAIPLGVFLSILGGFLFFQPLSLIYAVCSATMGSIIFFWVARTSLGDFLSKRWGSKLIRIEKEIENNGPSYLLFLRLIPIFPLALVNLAAALLRVPFWRFIWTTFFGIIPIMFIYTQIGAAMGSILDIHQSLSFNTLFNLHVKLALIGLALFVLLPILIKKLYRS